MVWVALAVVASSLLVPALREWRESRAHRRELERLLASQERGPPRLRVINGGRS